MKIIKYTIGVTIIIVFLFYLIVLFIAASFVGNNGTGKIKFYEYKVNYIELKKEIVNISKMSSLTITIKDSVEIHKDRHDRPISNIIIKNKKTLSSTNYIIYYPTNSEELTEYDAGITTNFILVYINGKTNKQLGWFSLEKYRGIKLFEETIIEPLSKKHERIKK